MDGGFGVAGATLTGRLRRYRWWPARLLVALPAVPLLAYGPNSPRYVDGAADPETVFWNDGALPFLLLAATLTLWRAPEEGLPDALRLRDRHRRVCRRVAVVLLLGACCALGVDHWYTWHPDTAAAGAAGSIGATLFWLALVPLALEPVLWSFWPAPIRRAVRTARAAEALYRPRARRSPGRRRFVPKPVAGDITDFDADLGASGRPRPLLHLSAGPRSQKKATAPSRARQRHRGPFLHWDGAGLLVGDGRGRTRTVPLADESHPEGVAELVWLGPAERLVFLDRDGYRVARSVSGLGARSGTVSQVAKAAGLTFHAYELTSWPETGAEQARLLFPGRSRLVRLLRGRLAR